MRRKVFATVVTLALSAAMLAGCGNSADSSTAIYEEPVNPAVYAEDDEDTPKVSANDEAEKPPKESSEENANDEATDAPNADSESATSSGLVDAAEEDAPESGEVEGIITLRHYSYQADDGVSGICVYSIKSVDPNTGVSTEIAEFPVRIPYSKTSEEFYYLTPVIGDANLLGDDRRYFSSDFSKMVITKIFSDKNETHAGWIDQAGNFFDVTEALGEQSSDFGDPVTYGAVGFVDDLFVYNDHPYILSLEPNFRFTDINVSSASQEGNPLQDYCKIINGDKTYAISDYISNDMCLVFYKDKKGKTISAKYDMNSGEIVPYIPGESRSNWSGVCSPDGSRIAFLSMPTEGNGNPEIFIIPFEGGEPEKLDCDIVFGNDTMINPSSILEWK